MPDVSRLYGILIRFYDRDHPPLHFHGLYGEHEAVIQIETGAIVQGHLPKSAYDLVTRSPSMHLPELREAWSNAREQLPLLPIAPLE